MSPLAKLLQIRPSPECPSEGSRSIAGRIWKRFLEVLRSAKVQRRVRRLEIVERVALGSKQSVVLLRVDQREFVVGCCGDSVVLLVPPVPDPVKEQPKRRNHPKPKRVQPPVLAPVAAVVAVAAPVKARQNSEAKAPQIKLSLKGQVPTKARLIKSFARKTR
jgi:flagellar biogenesis protein FliO